MSEAKHTPGPWTHEGHGDITVTENGRKYYVACVYLRIPAGRQEANARLIAAAPDLLEAMYAVLHDCDNLDMVESNEPGRDKSAYEMIHAAIAKATKVQT